MMDKKKATAPGSSVGADGKQPLCNKHNEIITDDQRQNNLQATGNVGITDKKVSPGKSRQDILQTVTMEELYDTVYPPKVPIVDGLLYNGTYLFVGAPKVGKSFFMAQLGYHVSRGIQLWDYPVNGGTVLYLALEDDYGRLQKRLSRMFGVESTDAFHLATRSKTLNQGLEEQLSRFVAEHKDARLIIIDTLQKVREVGGDKYSYASDYDIVTRLKKFSDEHAICLLLVHHTRKLESSDSFDMISGTNGLLGAADGNQIIHVLHKNAQYPFGDFFQRFHKTPSGILVNGSILKELFANNLGVFEAYGRNKLYIHLYALSRRIHLFVRLWNIFRIGWMNCHHALFTEKSV